MTEAQAWMIELRSEYKWQALEAASEEINVDLSASTMQKAERGADIKVSTHARIKALYNHLIKNGEES